MSTNFFVGLTIKETVVRLHQLSSWSLLLALSLPAWVYAEIPVSNGGTIAGKVVLEGEVLPPLGYSLVTSPDTEFCERISTGTGWRLLEEFHVASDGGLQNTIVFLDGVVEGKPFPEETPVRIMAQDCVFTPWVTVVKDRSLSTLSILSIWIRSFTMCRFMRRCPSEPKSCFIDRFGLIRIIIPSICCKTININQAKR